MLRQSCCRRAAQATDFYLVGPLLMTAPLIVATAHADTAVPQDTIRVRTIITNGNWKQLAHFMPISMHMILGLQGIE